MTTLQVSASFISVQSIKPSQAFGTLAAVPLKSGAKEILIRAGRTTLPKGAIVTSAELHLAQQDDWSGTNHVSARLNLGSWDSDVTWNTRPTVRSTASDIQAKTSSPAGAVWVLDVTDDVQDLYSGTIQHNYGWTLRTDNAATAHYLRGRKATSSKPFLLIEYQVTPYVPTELTPHGGAVSVAKPVLTFQSSDNMTALQVQIDAAADSVSPDFDSGEVAATGGLLDLSATAYAGLANGATTYWRARAKSAGGWSKWSTWVDFSREDLDPVTLTSPGVTTADTSPPFAWTFGGTQKSFRADLLLVSGSSVKVLRSSGLRSGADDNWTPDPLTGSYFGKTLRARIRVFDDVTRVATPGAHTYSEDIVDFVAGFTATVDPMDSLTATQPVADSPGVLLEGDRAAGVPDEVAVFHDDVMVARLDGGAVFTTGTHFSFTDWWGRMGRETVITVVAIVNGDFADDPPSATIAPKCRGVWLVEPDSGVAAVLWGDDAGQWSQDDVATVHFTTDGQSVRRRLANALKSGTTDGDVIDVGDLEAQDTLDALETFRGLDAATIYRFIDGQTNLPVIAGNFLDYPTSIEGGGEVYSRGHFDWWGKDEPTIADGS